MSSDTSVRAAIDVGSNTTRLLAAELAGGCIAAELARDMRITGLARGFDGENLAWDSMQRARVAIEEFCGRSERLGCDSVVAGFTGVARRAKNIGVLLDELRSLGRLRTYVLTEELEAGLSARGVEAKTEQRDFLLVDVGGGSTEIAVSTGGGFEFTSFSVGTVDMEERYALSGAVPAHLLREMREDVCARLREAEKWSDLHLPLFANAATATLCAAVLNGLDGWDSGKIEGFEVDAAELDRLLAELSAIDEAERVRRFPLVRGRERVFICGLVVLSCALEVLRRESFIVTEGSLLEGLLFYDEGRFDGGKG